VAYDGVHMSEGMRAIGANGYAPALNEVRKEVEWTQDTKEDCKELHITIHFGHLKKHPFRTISYVSSHIRTPEAQTPRYNRAESIEPSSFEERQQTRLNI
jgi:hypothetical protein